jgi:hypothetical protein
MNEAFVTCRSAKSLCIPDSAEVLGYATLANTGNRGIIIFALSGISTAKLSELRSQYGFVIITQGAQFRH